MLPVTTLFANPDPNAAPATLQALIDLLNQLVASEVTGTYTPHVIGAVTPATDDQDKLWFKLDSGGRPIGWFKYYSGNWRRAYTGKPNEVIGYTGDPTVDFDGTGLGIVGGNWDGFALMNGNNGTANLTDKFLVCAHMDGSGGVAAYASGVWRTQQDAVVGATGGSTGFTSAAGNTFAPSHPELKVGRWTADGNTPNAGAGLYGTGTDTTLIAADAGVPSPTRIVTLPPYLAYAPVKFVGYA